MVAQLKAGSFAMVLNPSLRDAGRLESDPKYQPVTNPYTGRRDTAGWNVGHTPLNNKLVRQALDFAMNRHRFFRGHGPAGVESADHPALDSADPKIIASYTVPGNALGAFSHYYTLKTV